MNKPLFACIPYALLIHPPIAHRHTGEDRRCLSPFEFAIAIGLTMAARDAWIGDIHARAFKASGKAIQREKEYAEQFKREWHETRMKRRRGASKEEAPAPKRQHTFAAAPRYEAENMKRAFRGRADDRSPHKPLPLPKSLKIAGQAAYRRRSKALRAQPPPDEIILDLSRYAILLSAGLATRGDNLDRVEDAIDRLGKPVGTGDGAISPLIYSWQRLRSGNLRLRVSGKWLEPPYGCVPWPLPRSATPLALYLFLHAIRTGPRNKKGIPFRALCERLGISTRPYAFDCQRVLDHALEAVNDHLGTLDIKALQQLPRKIRITVPARYELEADSDQLCFRAISRRDPDVEEDLQNDDAPMRARKRITRVIPRRHIERSMSSPETRAKEREEKLAEIAERRMLWKQYDKGDMSAAWKLGVPGIFSQENS